jgi:glycosyltransferase involved in cell wall biosynthesis
MVIPSRLDNLPNTGVEAHSCGTPVAAFNIGGLPDIVDHLNTGYLAKSYDTVDLARGIKWILDRREDENLRHQARKRAVERFGENGVVEQYLAIYKHVINSQLPA